MRDFLENTLEWRVYVLSDGDGIMATTFLNEEFSRYYELEAGKTEEEILDNVKEEILQDIVYAFTTLLEEFPISFVKVEGDVMETVSVDVRRSVMSTALN